MKIFEKILIALFSEDLEKVFEEKKEEELKKQKRALARTFGDYKKVTPEGAVLFSEYGREWLTGVLEKIQDEVHPAQLSRMPIPPFVEVLPIPLAEEPYEEYGARICTKISFRDEVLSLVSEWVSHLETAEVPPWLGVWRWSEGTGFGSYGGGGFSERPFLKEGTTLEDIRAWAEEFKQKFCTESVLN